MKPIGFDDINSLQRVRQIFHDCYLVTSLNALSRSKNGRKILQNNIAKDCDNYRVRFQNINDKVEDFFVNEKEIEDLTLVDKFLNPIELDFPKNPIISAVEIAMNKMLTKYPDKKPLSSRLFECSEKFEYNRPSNFLEWFTGKKPISINEASLRMSLRSKKKEAVELLEQIGETEDNNSFVIGSGHNFIKGITNWHCYTIEKIDLKNRTVTIFDNKYRDEIVMPFNDLIKKFKYITGFFDDSLK